MNSEAVADINSNKELHRENNHSSYKRKKDLKIRSVGNQLQVVQKVKDLLLFDLVTIIRRSQKVPPPL